MVNNFELIRSYLNFNNSDEFYFLQIIQRKKDNNENLHFRNGYRVIKSYYIYSLEEFDELKDRIIELCNSNNARAYINLNIRNAKEAALECIKRYTDLVLNNNSFQGNNIWDSVCRSTKARKYKSLWIVDLDSKDEEYISKIIDLINKCRGACEYKIITQIPTVNGFHLITIRFDIEQFKQLLALYKLDNVDIHKDNPTLLYYNN